MLKEHLFLTLFLNTDIDHTLSFIINSHLLDKLRMEFFLNAAELSLNSVN